MRRNEAVTDKETPYFDTESKYKHKKLLLKMQGKSGRSRRNGANHFLTEQTSPNVNSPKILEHSSTEQNLKSNIIVAGKRSAIFRV